MSIPLPSLDPPPSRLMVEMSHFLHPQSRHRKIIENHPCNYQVNLMIPMTENQKPPEESISQLYSTYYEAAISLSSIVHPAFVEAFVKRGNLQLVSCKGGVNTDNVISLSRDGHLHLHLLKESYEKLGLVGKPSAYGKKSHFVKYHVDIDLCCKNFSPGKKYYERVKLCLSNHLTEVFPVVFSWKPDDEDIAPVSVCRYFQSIGFDCKEYEPSVSSILLQTAGCPIVDPENPESDSNKSVHYKEFYEWLGLAACRALDTNSAEEPVDEFLSTYTPPTPCRPAAAIYQQVATGLISACDIHRQLDTLRELSAEFGWCALTVHGFSDTPVTWSSKEHGFLMDGDNLYTFVVFPSGVYWLFIASAKSRSLPTDLPLNDIISPVKEYIATSGIYWKIYRASLLVTDADVSVFVFDKNAISKLKEKKKILSLVNKHLEVLKRLQKYSHVCLKLVLSPRENRRFIMFATEPVLGSLANVLGDYPSDISATRTTMFNKASMSELEVKYGITIVAETLSYLHLSERLLHCDISPRNILVCADRSWKLFGFYFCVESNAELPFTMEPEPTRLNHDWLQPDVNFASPCLYLGTPTTEGDVLSLGMILTAIYNNGISLLEGTAVMSQIFNHTRKSDLECDYNEKIYYAYNAIKPRIPEGLQSGLSRIISFNPDRRPTAQQLLMLAFFQDPALKCLKQLASLETMPQSQKEELFTVTLPECAKRFSQTLLQLHVFPILLDLLTNQSWTPGVMSLMVTFLERCHSVSVIESLCPEVNRVIENSNWLSEQSFQVLLDRLPRLIDKCYRIPRLTDPFQLLRQGLADDERMVGTLSTITNLISSQLSTLLNLKDRLFTEIQVCMTRLIEQNKPWLTIMSDEQFTEEVCSWLLQLFRSHYDLIDDHVTDLWYKLLSNASTVKLTKTFMKAKIIPAMETFFLLPDITVLQRQKLMQLVCKLDLYCEDTAHRPTSLELSAPCHAKSDFCYSRRRPPIWNSDKCLTSPQTPSKHPIPVIIEIFDDSTTATTATSMTSLTPLLSSQTSQTSTTDSGSTSRLFHLGLAEVKEQRKSFGELMVDIDERNDRQWRQCSPLLNRGRSATVSSVASSSLSVDVRDHPSSSSSCNQSPAQRTEDTFVDCEIMKSLLMRLDSLTQHFTSGTEEVDTNKDNG